MIQKLWWVSNGGKDASEAEWERSVRQVGEHVDVVAAAPCCQHLHRQQLKSDQFQLSIFVDPCKTTTTPRVHFTDTTKQSQVLWPAGSV